MGSTWLWGEKKFRKKVPYTQTNREEQFMSNKVQLHLELIVESPISQDVVGVVEQMGISYNLPPNVKIKSSHLTLVELLSRGGIS
jgi:hypothetical protein